MLEQKDVSPEKPLYHYSSIESFAQILKNKTIRFKRLDLVNDPDEVKIENLNSIKKLVYATSWTEKETEVIPMWKLYTKNSDGVRIRMPISMFYDGESQYKSRTINNRQILNVVKTFRKGFSVFRDDNKDDFFSFVDEFKQVIYDDDNSMKNLTLVGIGALEGYPEFSEYIIDIVENKEIENRLIHRKIGLTKKKTWEFEHEWRSRIAVFGFKRSFGEFHELCNGDKYPSISEYFDIPLNKDAFRNFEVLIGPNADKSSKIIIEALLEKYLSNDNSLGSVNWKIRYSMFKDKI